MQYKDKTKKKNKTEEWKWEDKEKPMTKKECKLEEEIFVDLDHGSTPLAYFKRLQEWINFWKSL